MLEACQKQDLVEAKNAQGYISYVSVCGVIKLLKQKLMGLISTWCTICTSFIWKWSEVTLSYFSRQLLTCDGVIL